MSQSNATFPPSLSSLLKSVPRKPDVLPVASVSPMKEQEPSVSGSGTLLAGGKQLKPVTVESLKKVFMDYHRQFGQQTGGKVAR